MAIFNFSKSEREAIARKIQQYFLKEMDLEIGQFQAGFLLTFFAEEIGPYFYNRGLQDSQAILRKRIDEISEAIETLEKPTDARRV
jgi:uncharacterized protein (DUF2164 family)